MTERRKGGGDEVKSVFRSEGPRLFLGDNEVITSTRSLPDREENLLGYSCSEGDYFVSAQKLQYFEALRNFGSHVHDEHVGPGKSVGREVKLERVYRIGSSRGGRYR